MKLLNLTPHVSLLLLGLGLFSLLAAQRAKPMSLEQTLQASEWKKRVLLIAAPTAEHADFRAQKALLAKAQSQLDERDFLVLDVLYDQLPATDKQYLTNKIGVNPSRFAAVLIGKDGGVKMKSARPIAPAALFGTVDKMPMRKHEMQRGVVDTD
ncbi:MAG TPA: DUF4174 domain-containing protein [Hymenobacter sp.]|jgi:hypothetical protein